MLGIIGNAGGRTLRHLAGRTDFVSGCQLLISIKPSGQISPGLEPPCLVLIDKALHDEGTIYHYQPPGDFSHGDADILARLKTHFTIFRSRHVAGPRGPPTRPTGKLRPPSMPNGN